MKPVNLRQRSRYLAAVIFIALSVNIVLSLNIGYIRITPIEAVKVLVGNGSQQDAMILYHFRLPRIIISMFIGAGMAVSGTLLQTLTKNDLSDPGILGINSGAGLFVILYMFFWQGSDTVQSDFSAFVLPIMAFAGALCAAGLIYLTSWKQGIQPTRLILTGAGLNGAFASLIILFQLKMDPNDFMQAVVWLSGSIWATDWNYVWAILPWIGLLIPLSVLRAPVLNILTFGDQIATGLGAHVERERALFLLIAVALSGSCVAVGGGISFLGLIVPHIMGRLLGRRQLKYLIPLTALMGAFFLLLADTLARSVWAPDEIPVGLIVSIIGAPYFIYLLLRR